MNTFSEQVYKQLRKVPKGKITTYQDLAHTVGTRAYRAVGTAMKNNPDIPKTPCHRVVRSDRSVGQYAGGEQEKIQMLKGEGIIINNGKIQDFNNKKFVFQ